MPKTARRGAEIGRWRRRRKNENGLTNNHLGKRTSCERRGGGGETLLNEIWDCDDVVLPQAISAATLWRRARCCLDMSVRLCFACTLFLERITELRSENNPNVKQGCKPLPHAGPVWTEVENNSTYKDHRGFAVVSPPVDRNLRSRQECVRAWSWLSSEQISVCRQVCSACPHSCSCLQLFLFLLGTTFTMWCVVKEECWHKITMCEVFLLNTL